MDAKSCDADLIFRIFTACPHDIPTILIDTRPNKEFKHLHIAGAFCVRLSTNGQVLADYSQASYAIKWSQDCWWGRNVVVYGDSSLKKDHPVVKFLAAQGKCRSLHYYKDGFEAFERKYPFLCTTSVKSACINKYPSQIVPGFLYLGDWEHATATERLEELRVRRIVTIHNHPENLRPAAGGPVRHHLRLPLPDIEDADISQHFQRAYEFMEEGRQKGEAVLVHCGAGVSRSATLVMMYLMRHHVWPAAKAQAYVKERRSLVCINDGFWATLCALEAGIGIPASQRSDASAGTGFRGADADGDDDAGGGGGGGAAAAAKALSRDAAGEKVTVVMRSAKELEEGGGKRGREGGGDGGRDAKRQAVAGQGVLLTLEVRKPEGVVGQLAVGPLAFTQRCVLGRAPGCDVVLEHASISRQHAQITADRSGAVFITDLQSGHGTKVGDVWVKPNAPRQLQLGTVVSFGASTRTYKVVGLDKV